MSAHVRGGGLLAPEHRSRPVARSVAGAVAGGFLLGVMLGWAKAHRGQEAGRG